MAMALLAWAQEQPFEEQPTEEQPTEEQPTEEPMKCEAHSDCTELDDCAWGNCTQYCDMGSNCFPACQCEAWEDAIDGVCPTVENCTTFDTCETHSDCPPAGEMCLYNDCSQYCDENNRCFPACECSHWEDSVDGECPPMEEEGCNLNYRQCGSHDDCEMGEYCDENKHCWGLCDCFWYKDPFDGACPADQSVEAFCVSLADEIEDHSIPRPEIEERMENDMEEYEDTEIEMGEEEDMP